MGRIRPEEVATAVARELRRAPRAAAAGLAARPC